MTAQNQPDAGETVPNPDVEPLNLFQDLRLRPPGAKVILDEPSGGVSASCSSYSPFAPPWDRAWWPKDRDTSRAPARICCDGACRQGRDCPAVDPRATRQLKSSIGAGSRGECLHQPASCPPASDDRAGPCSDSFGPTSTSEDFGPVRGFMSSLGLVLGSILLAWVVVVIVESLRAGGAR